MNKQLFKKAFIESISEFIETTKTFVIILAVGSLIALIGCFIINGIYILLNKLFNYNLVIGIISTFIILFAICILINTLFKYSDLKNKYNKKMEEQA